MTRAFTRSALVLLGLGACGVPAARFEQLETSFDAAAAARDRAQAELDACHAAAAARERELEAARAPEAQVAAALAALPGAGPRGWTTPASAWFAPGTADLTATAPATLTAVAAALAALPPGVVTIRVGAAGEPRDAREYPSERHLAADRAIALTEALVRAGTPAERLAAVAVAGPPEVTVAFLAGW